MTTGSSTAERQAALRDEAQAWLLRLTSGQVTAGEAEAFRQWCAQSPEHAQAFAEARLLWESLQPAAQAAWRREQPDGSSRRSPASPSRGSHRMSRRAFLGGAVAASAAYALARPPFGLWPAWSDLTADYRTGTGEQRHIEVGVGVTVELNTQTAVNLRSMGDGFMSMELLSGEAQVLTNTQLARPFTVFAGGGRILAQAATQCNVRCTGPEASVICVNGRTELNCGGRSAAVLPAQQVQFGAGGIGTASTVDPEVAMSWRRRVLIFDHRPLSEVVAEINRYRHGKIILMNDELAARKVQARFALSQLADVAALIHDAYGAQVTTLPGGVVLLS